MIQKYQYIQPVMKPASSPKRKSIVFVEAADGRVGRCHLAEHAHYQHHQHDR
jgi:hypothetical protein